MADDSATVASARVMKMSAPGGLAYSVRVALAVARKDVRISLIERTFTLVSILLPINFLLLFLLVALTGGEAPTAVVLQERGPLARQFVTQMEHAHSFIIRETSAQQARQLLQQGSIVAIVTIPPDFDQRLREGEHISLPVEVNNLNADFTNDIRRAIPLTITQFYARVFPDQVVVQAREHDVQPRDTNYIQYLSVSIVVIALLIGGVLQTGINTAREYESGTMKVLLLSPASRWATLLGKTLGAGILALASLLGVLAVVIVLLGVRPAHWAELTVFSLLLLLTFLAIGQLIGTWLQRRLAVIPLTLGLSLPLFFVSGAFGPPQWGNPIVAAVAQVMPVYYAIGVFQHAFHGFTVIPQSPGVAAAVLLAFSVASFVISVLIVDRRGVAH